MLFDDILKSVLLFHEGSLPVFRSKGEQLNNSHEILFIFIFIEPPLGNCIESFSEGLIIVIQKLKARDVPGTFPLDFQAFIIEEEQIAQRFAQVDIINRMNIFHKIYLGGRKLINLCQLVL